jgi:hypothetical protein
MEGFDWVTPFALGIGAICGYALLGPAWLVLNTDGASRNWD